MEKIEELTKEIKELEIRLEEAKKTLINLRLREIHCLINVSNINI
jgi:ribosomal protein L29